MDGDDEEEEEGEREEEDAREEDEREQVEGEVDSQVPSGRHGMPALAWSACTDTACCGEQVTTAKMQSKNEDATGTGVRVVSQLVLPCNITSRGGAFYPLLTLSLRSYPT